jgi:lipase chaperone LimK
MPVFNIPLTILVPVLLFALACFLLAPDSLTESSTTPATSPATTPAPSASGTEDPAKYRAEQQPDKAALPASLSGTEHGVTLSAQQQQLVVHSSLRDLFDYYLSTLGERDNLWIDTQVRAALARQLSGQPLAQAEHIWQQYLSYREQLALLPAAAEDASTYQRLQYYFDSRVALQDQIFGHAVAAALFAFDREQDALALQQLQHKEINEPKEQQNTSADNSNQQTLLNASYQQSWATRQYQQENAKTQQLLAIEQSSDDPAQRFAQRAAIAGEQQAVQLAALDQQRNQWQQQLTAFQQQVQAIKQQQLSADEEQKQIDLQLQQAFPPEQHLRVKALSGLL